VQHLRVMTSIRLVELDIGGFNRQLSAGWHGISRVYRQFIRTCSHCSWSILVNPSPCSVTVTNVDVSISVSPRRDDGGPPIGAATISRDIAGLNES
jgi:hypothetical protein